MFRQIKFNLYKSRNKYLTIILFLIVFSGIKAQFNTEIGYTVSYVGGKNMNAIIHSYNSKYNEMITEMKDLKYINGFNAGASYRFKILKVGAYWESQTAYKNGIDGSLQSETNNEKKLYFYFNSVGAGLDFLTRYVGLGTIFDYNLFRIKTKKSGLANKVDVVKENYLSNKFHLIFNLKFSKNLGIQLRPFIIVPWQKVDLSPATNYLLDKEYSEKLDSDFIFYGISMIIMNGKQG